MPEAQKTWRDVLAEAGFPTEAVVLDFETYFDKDYSLSKLSTVEYVMDERFELTGLGVTDLYGQPHFLEPVEVAHFLSRMQAEYGDDLSGMTVVVQRGKFDCLILREKFGITPKYVVDIIDLDKMWDARASHKLKDLVERWHAPSPKGDTTEFLGLHWRDMNDQKRARLCEYTINDVEIEAWLFETMMPVVVSRPAVELPVANHTLQMYLEPSFEIDLDLGERIVAGMKVEMQDPIDRLNKMGMMYAEPAKGAANMPGTPTWARRLEEWVLSGGEGDLPLLCKPPRPIVAGDISKDSSFTHLVEAAGGVVPMKQGKNKMIPALAKDDEGIRELLAHSDARVRALAQARQAVQSWPLHLAKVENILAQARRRNGLIGTPLGYHNAHTGRWGGTEGINLQNLGGSGRGGKGTHLLIRQVRNMLRAPKGYLLGINDYSKVECVGVAWQARQDDLLEAFRTGADVYSELATELFGFPVRKPGKLDPKPIHDRLDVCRGFGKDAILGCGYKMWANTFYERCYANDALRPKFDDGTFDMAFIEKVIKTYRAKFPKIADYWDQLEKSWRWVTKYPRDCVTLDQCGLEFFHEGGATFIRLPSGRLQRYADAAVNKTGKLSYRWGSLWAGTLTENVVSGLCRDFIAESILRLIANGFRVVLTVHDEIVCLLAEKDAEARLKEMGEIMCQLPAWATDFPLSVEGCLSEMYKK